MFYDKNILRILSGYFKNCIQFTFRFLLGEANFSLFSHWRFTTDNLIHFLFPD